MKSGRIIVALAAIGWICAIGAIVWTGGLREALEWLTANMRR